MSKSVVTIEVEVDPQGKASVALRSLDGDVQRLGAGVDRAGQSGIKLKDIFSGNLLADFFQRGVSGAVAFTAQSLQATALASDANRVLEFSATRAGIAYTSAAEQAEDFGKRVGASNTAAAATFADIIRLAERAGRSQDLDLISKRFADLSAARGIRGAELQTLIGTILSGQDEGLNRLGIDDPGKLNAAYAAQVGKTADALTQQEKARAALNAVLEKGAEAEGQAAARLSGTAGQLDSASASYQNLDTQIGEAVATSIEFRDVLSTISDALSEVVTSHAEARRELSLGLKTPEQIAQEERDSFGRQTFNAFKGGSSLLFGAGFTLYDQALLATGQISLDEYNTRSSGTADAAFNPGQRQYEARVAQLRQLQEDIKRQEAEAGKQQGEQARLAAASARDAALQSVFSTNAAAAFKEENLDSRLAQLKELKDELRTLPDVVDADGVKKQSAKIEDAIKETTKQITQAVRTARDAVREFLSDSLVKSDKDNQFIQLFVQLETAEERARLKFGVFGKEFADMMARVEKDSLRAEIAVARFTSQISAIKSLQEARRLEQPLVGLTGTEERRLEVISARISDITKGRDLDRQIRQLENPYRRFTAVDARRDFREQLHELLGLSPGGSGFAGQKAIADAVLQLTGQVDPRTLATSSDPVLRAARFARLDALKVQREASLREIRDAVQREQTGSFIQKDARELLQAIQASGLRDDVKVKEFLSVTGGLSEKELTPDLRRARVGALREQARIESQKESQAEERAKKLTALVEKLTALITDKGIKVDAPPSNVNVNVGDGLALDHLTGAQPSPADARVVPGYGQGFRS